VWNEVILKCLQPRPEDRFQKASQVIQALEQASAIQDLPKLDAKSLKQDSGTAADKLRAWASLAKPKSRWVKVWTGILILLVSTMALAAAWIFTERLRAPGQPGLPNMTFTKLTSQPGTEYFPSFSPDGRSFIYAGLANGNWDIYLQHVGGQNPMNLTADSPDDETQPAFSPDGEFIAFRSERDGGGIFIMGATGENVRRLTDFGYNPSWSPSGSEIVFADQSVVDAPYFRAVTSALWAVNVRSGERRLITKGDGVEPQWSPHGDRIVYWSYEPGANREIWTIRPDGTDALPVTTEPGINWSPAWSHDGAYIYFSSDRAGNTNLWRVPINEKSGKILGSAERVTTGGGLVQRQHAALSRDGTRIAYVEESATENLQKIVFDPVREKVLGAPDWVTRGSRVAANPDPSLDGQWLAFQSLEKQEDLFLIRSDGSGQRQLTSDIYSDRVPRWSPDGKRITFYSNRSGEYEAWLINADGSNLEQLTHSGSRRVTRSVWSPDGTKLALFYSSDNVSSIFDIASHSETPLPLMSDPSEHFNVWSWSPDGKWLAGHRRVTASGYTKGVSIYSIDRQQYEDITDRGDDPTWLADSRRLLFENNGKVSLVDRVSKKAHDVFVPSSYTVNSLGQISPDNRMIYFSLIAREADIWLINLNDPQNPAR
jgi:Tol biopolymer transport system component